jgi:hypothetical protein
MSAKRKMTRAAKEKQPKKRPTNDFDDVIQDTAAVFSCLHETAQDFEYQCKTNVEDLKGDLRFTQFAHEIWSGKPGRAQELSAALDALRTERQRHLDTLTTISRAFTRLANDNIHEHLDVLDKEYVRRRLFPKSPLE